MMIDDPITEGEVKQLKAYLEMKAQSLEDAAETFTSNYDRALSIAKANGFREALQVIESSSYKWYKTLSAGQAEGRPMIDIEKLQPGDTVRHVGSGRAYVVKSVHSMTRRVFAIRQIEISNPDEWEAVPPKKRRGNLAAVDEESLTP